MISICPTYYRAKEGLYVPLVYLSYGYAIRALHASEIAFLETQIER